MATDRDGHDLVSCDAIVGSRVFDRSGRRVAQIVNVMIDRGSGRVGHVLVSKGGLLSWGRQSHPLAWAELRYDHQRGGYVLTGELTSGGPHEGPNLEHGTT